MNNFQFFFRSLFFILCDLKHWNYSLVKRVDAHKFRIEQIFISFLIYLALKSTYRYSVLPSYSSYYPLQTNAYVNKRCMSDVIDIYYVHCFMESTYSDSNHDEIV